MRQIRPSLIPIQWEGLQHLLAVQGNAITNIVNELLNFFGRYKSLQYVIIQWKWSAIEFNQWQL